MNQRENIRYFNWKVGLGEGGVRAVLQDEAREYAAAGGPGFGGPCVLRFKTLGLIICEEGLYNVFSTCIPTILY